MMINSHAGKMETSTPRDCCGGAASVLNFLPGLTGGGPVGEQTAEAWSERIYRI